MIKYLTMAALALLISTGANAQGFPCQAFQMQPNGMLAVIQSVTMKGPNGQITVNPGASFGPGSLWMGVNLYALYQQNCH
jgi:hypothetical protein